jgi:branched-chain amino acid transport system substrate-binding protein
MKFRLIPFVVALLGMLFGSIAFAAPSLKIGGLFAVTGPAAFLGEPERNTAMMVVSEINRAGGIRGQKLELVVYDTAGDATKAVQLANKLIKSDRVMAIIGPSTTGESMAVIPVAERGRVPLISCAAGIKITEPLKKWVFKTAQNDSLAVIRIYEHLRKQRLQRVALLTVSDGFGASGREQLKVQAARYGIRIVSDDTYGPKDTDMTSQLTKIRGLKPDAIICWGTNPGPAVVTKNARQLGIRTPLYMSHGVSSKKYIQLAGQAAEGVKLPSGRVIVADQLPATDPQKRSLIAFVKGYERYYKTEGDHFGGHAWDAVMLLKGAFERGATTPAAVRDQLENTRQFHGIGGSFTFTPRDHAGLGKDAFVLVEVRKGDWAIVK